MSKKLFFVVILIILFFVGISFFRNKTGPLISPSVTTPLPSSEINQPKEIKYDSSTDLKQELETINPQVLDSDFE